MRSLGFALSADEPSLAAELWDYFCEKYFSASSDVYLNLGINESSLPLCYIIGGIVLGAIFACLAITVYKKVVCSLVEKLLAAGAVGRENARTLDEIGYKNPAILRSLRGSASLRRVVKSLEETEHYEKKTEATKEYEVSLSDRFYIPEDKRDFAEVRFETRGASWPRFALIAVICIVGYFVLMEAVPVLLGALDELVGSMKS